MAGRSDRIDFFDCEFCRDDSHARSFSRDLRKIIFLVFELSGFSHSQGQNPNPSRTLAREAENGRLKKLVAERDLEIEVMKEVAAKKW